MDKGLQEGLAVAVVGGPGLRQRRQCRHRRFIERRL
jgi:hypothetical protein